jgi:hypothetical protein
MAIAKIEKKLDKILRTVHILVPLVRNSHWGHNVLHGVLLNRKTMNGLITVFIGGFAICLMLFYLATHRKNPTERKM